MIPTLKRIYKHLLTGKHVLFEYAECMYTKIKKKWKKADKKDVYSIVGRLVDQKILKRLEKSNILLEKALKTIICNNIYNCYVVF